MRRLCIDHFLIASILTIFEHAPFFTTWRSLLYLPSTILYLYIHMIMVVFAWLTMYKVSPSLPLKLPWYGILTRKHRVYGVLDLAWATLQLARRLGRRPQSLPLVSQWNREPMIERSRNGSWGMKRAERNQTFQSRKQFVSFRIAKANNWHLPRTLIQSS